MDENHPSSATTQFRRLSSEELEYHRVNCHVFPIHHTFFSMTRGLDQMLHNILLKITGQPPRSLSKSFLFARSWQEEAGKAIPEIH